LLIGAAKEVFALVDGRGRHFCWLKQPRRN